MCLFLTGCGKETKTETKPYLSRQDFVLGTIATVKLYDHQSEKILDAAFNKLDEIENILSINKTNTLLDAINENAGVAPAQVDEATYNVIEKGVYYSKLTSGIYERYLETEYGKKYHHILNRSTGYPYDNPIAGVSIISDFSIDGDALSTSTFALGIEEGLEFIEKLDGIDAIFVTTNRKVYEHLA